MTHATHRFLAGHPSTSRLHGVPLRRVASGSIDITTRRNSILTHSICGFAKRLLKHAYTGFAPFYDPRTCIFFNNLAGTNSLVVGPVGRTCSTGIRGVFGKGTGVLISRLSSTSTTILNTTTLT